MLVRKEHWATRAFNDFLMARAREPFAWGSNDCALMAADGIEAMTGVDIAADFRGRYSTEAEAFALIRAVTGGETVEDAAAYCAAQFDLPEWVYPWGASRGDLVILPDQGRLISGLVHLNGRDVVAVGEEGLKRLSFTSIVRAWHV
jgi:hypothetical protein